MNHKLCDESLRSDPTRPFPKKRHFFDDDTDSDSDNERLPTIPKSLKRRLKKDCSDSSDSSDSESDDDGSFFGPPSKKFKSD